MDWDSFGISYNVSEVILLSTPNALVLIILTEFNLYNEQIKEVTIDKLMI